MTDTLSYHKQRPLMRRMNLANVPVGEVSGMWNKVHDLLKQREGTLKVDPVKEAVWFYLTNHIMMEVAQRLHDDEPLEKYLYIVDDYHSRIMTKSLRMFYYLLMITTREARHAKQGHKLTAVWDKYPDIKMFHKKTLGHNEMYAVNELATNPPNVTLGEYTDFLVDQFNKASYGNCFGGKAWGKVAKCLREFVHGRTSAEMMMDTAFTLAHNTGPIFNKGMLFETQNNGQLRMVLDVQRSGQIPQLVVEGELFIDSEMTLYMKDVSKLIPKFNGGYVDWYLVEKLGAIGSYSGQKNAQYSKYGKSNASKLAEMKAKAEKIKKQKKQAEFEATHFEVMPNLFVKKVKVARSAK